jgi:hypothetical protein
MCMFLLFYLIKFFVFVCIIIDRDKGDKHEILLLFVFFKNNDT